MIWTADPFNDNNSGDLNRDDNTIALAVETGLAETAVAETIAAMLVSADKVDVEPNATPLPTNTLAPSPTMTPIPTLTKTPRPSPTPTPSIKGVDDFSFGPGVIVVGSYPSIDSAKSDTNRYRSAGYTPAVFFRKANESRANDEYRVVLTGYDSESEAASALPGVQANHNSKAYTRDLTFWCPVHRDIDDGYECD